MEKSFLERHTKTEINPPLSLNEISEAVLPDSEYQSCLTKNHSINIDGWHMGMSHGCAKKLVPHIKEESLLNGKIQFIERISFGWSRAVKLVCKQFGFSSISTIGTSQKTTGLIISSIVTLNDAEEQIRKYAHFIRTLKQKFPKVQFLYENCQMTVQCDPKLTKALKDAMEA